MRCGFDHTLVLFEDKDKVKRLYSIGQDEVNFNHLGITAQEAEDKSVFYREVTSFKNFEIVDFAAGYRSSYVIIKGDEDPLSGVHEHEIDGIKHKGLLHFYQNNLKQWVFIPESDYEARKSELPPLTFATKYPISNFESREFPDLQALS